MKAKYEPQLPLQNNNTIYVDEFGFPLQQQQQPQQQQLAMPAQSDYAEFEDGYNAQPLGPPQQQQQQQIVKTAYSPFEALTDDEFLQPANVKYSKATFEAGRNISGAMLIDATTGRLRNKGTIIFSMENGHLRAINGSYKLDFAPLKAGVNALVSKARNDLVKSITVTMSSTYLGRLLLSFPTVAAIGNEMYRNNADHVNYTIPAGVFAGGKPYTFTVLDREIPTGVIAFTSVFNSTAPDTMDAEIVHTGRGYSLVPYNHTIVHYYNKEHENDGLAITEDSLMEHLSGDVQMDTETVMRLLAQAKQAVSTNISLGNVTTDMQVRLEAVEPTDYTTKLQRLQKQVQVTGNKGLLDSMAPYMAFADTQYTLGSNATTEQKQAHLNRIHTFDLTITTEYLKVDGSRPAELLPSNK